MAIAGAERGLGARLIAKWTVYPIRGVGPLRNEKPRMGVRGGRLEGGDGDDWPTQPHHDFRSPRFPNPDFRIPNSVWHMGNPEYRTMRTGTAGAHMGST
jgi:hypothetical protein